MANLSKDSLEKYTEFLLGNDYLFPTQAGIIYTASDLVAFFGKAQVELKELLNQLNKTDSEHYMHEFHLVGHGKTKSNMCDILTGWSGDLLCNTTNGKLGGIELALSQIGIIPSDEPSKNMLAETDITQININDYFIRFVGDLPRQIAHALYLTGDPSLVKKLEKIQDGILDTLFDKSGKIKDNLDPYKTHMGLVYPVLINLALDKGFIPTPLLRAQYYGPMELGPEKLKEEERSKFVEKFVNQAVNKDKARKEAEMLADALIQRKEILFAHLDEKGDYLTESRFDMVKRLGYFFESVGEVLPDGKKALVITSSGCIDVSPSYFRYLESGKKQWNIVTPKNKVRGEVIVIKYSDEGYLNDPLRLDPILEITTSVIENFKDRSHDANVKKGEGIIKPDFYTLVPKENKEEKTTVNLEELLTGDNGPALVLGNCGLGKTTFSLYLASKLIELSKKESKSDLKVDGKYMPVLVRLRNVGDQVSIESKITQFRKMTDLLSGGVLSLRPRQIEEYRKDGYNFVFILDGYDELNVNYAKNLNTIVDSLAPYGKVILTSRSIGFQKEKDGNLPYKTFHLNPDSIVTNLDNYLESRIEDINERQQFKGHLMRQTKELKENWLFISLLTKMYKDKGYRKEIDFSKNVSPQEVIQKGIRVLVWEHALERDPALFTAPIYDGDQKDEKSKSKYDAECLELREAARQTHLKKAMPKIKLIATYMTVTDQTVVTNEDIDKIFEGKWSLITEMQYRKGERDSRFLP
jgi:hypothetical protein